MVAKRPRAGSVKPKFLLDEGLPPRQRLKSCNQTWNMKHIASDYKLGGASDKTVYALASDENRIVITFNGKDFKKLVTPRSPSVIDVSHKVPPGKLDSLIHKSIVNMQPGDLLDKVVSVRAPNPSSSRRSG
ncbi:MAG TPA: DUF5615 family PIN-like protein [Candidatus Limnocylindria bacterium]|nr:DUF5615 family PIN-like protein [Candidatus Limnocylindria bacterium]